MITKAEIEKEIREKYSEDLLELVDIDNIIKELMLNKVVLDIDKILKDKL